MPENCRNPRRGHGSFGFKRSAKQSLLMQLLLLLCITIATVVAIKPIKNLHVTFRGQSYTIQDGCSTVEDLTKRFEKLSGTSGLNTPQIVWNGKFLKPTESLESAGVKPGDRVLIVPKESDAKGQDFLAIYMVLLSHINDSLTKTVDSMTDEQKENLKSFKEVMKEMAGDFNNLNRKDVADGLRHGFDVAYHRLRSWWERPQLRQALHDPDRIETYRKVVSTNMSPGIMKKSPRLQKAVKSKEEWRKEFVKIASNVIRLGDVILDGLLDLLLDVLKGQGSTWKYADRDRPGPATEGPFKDTLDPRLDDPALANELLFELSESDDD